MIILIFIFNIKDDHFLIHIDVILKDLIPKWGKTDCLDDFHAIKFEYVVA